jgi:hypothetical protein
MEDINTPVVKEFTTLALEFCQMMEKAGKQRTGELFNHLQQSLPLIYAKGSQLPKPKYRYEEESLRFVKEDDYARIHDALQQKIELFFGIAQMSPGTRPNEVELMSFALAETFADIYEELKNYVKLFEMGIPQAMNDAVWICRTNFEQQFGTKILESLKSLHQLIYKQGFEGSRAVQTDDFNESADEEEPWFSDDQEEIYGDED